MEKRTGMICRENPLLIKGIQHERKRRGNVEEEEERLLDWLLKLSFPHP